MAKHDPLALYNQYYVERDFERLDLFQQLADRYAVESSLYPGSFVHITPSFVYPSTAYVDNDKQAKRFFAAPEILDFVSEHKIYSQEPSLTFHAQSYTEDFDEQHERYDLLISQYAGFVSQACKHYLKIGGLLLANNSHGDASMASIDDQFALVAVVSRRNGVHRIVDTHLEDYLIPKSNQPVTKEWLEKSQRGISYKKPADMYIFKRII